MFCKLDSINIWFWNIANGTDKLEEKSAINFKMITDTCESVYEHHAGGDLEFDVHRGRGGRHYPHPGDGFVTIQ